MRRATIGVPVVIALAAGVLACNDQRAPTEASARGVMGQMSTNARDGAPMGTTDGWDDGQTVTFFYHKPFFCAEPPSSGATTHCEVGEDGTVDPRPGHIPFLFVMTPMGFRPPDNTLQCPVVGFCINHPSTIDLSRLAGPGAANAPLPAHSHIISSDAHADGGEAGWWEIVVIGVTDPAVWDQIVAGKSLATVRALQAQGAGITGDIRSNAYLFFAVRPKQ